MSEIGELVFIYVGWTNRLLKNKFIYYKNIFIKLIIKTVCITRLSLYEMYMIPSIINSNCNDAPSVIADVTMLLLLVNNNIFKNILYVLMEPV